METRPHTYVCLLTIEDTFWLERPGVQMLILHPYLYIPKDWEQNGWMARTESVWVVRPDGGELPATAQINVAHLNIRDPDVPIEERWKIALWLTDRTTQEVPAGSKIYGTPEVGAAMGVAAT